MSVLVVIPARYASTRFPGKPLAILGDKPMIQHVYEKVMLAKGVDKAVVATDDKRIYEKVTAFGGEVMMTSDKHQNGTDRVAEVAEHFTDYDIVINVQGDEPFLDPTDIEKLVLLLENDNNPIATLATAIKTSKSLFDANTVKVIFDQNAQAIYFSRHPIPFDRNAENENWIKNRVYFKHIGIYGFRRNVLLEVANLAPSALEKSESLEQLRWIENGYSIAVGITDKDAFGIDTPEDMAEAIRRL